MIYRTIFVFLLISMCGSADESDEWSMDEENSEVEVPRFPLVPDPFHSQKRFKANVCNNETLRRVITESVSTSASRSKKLISNTLLRLFPSSTYAIVCAECSFSYLSHTTDYCLHSSGNITCYVFRDGKL